LRCNWRGLGLYESNSHISGNINAGVVGKHPAIRNSEKQSAAPDLAHIDLIAHAFDLWRDMASELHLANTGGAAFAR